MTEYPYAGPDTMVPGETADDDPFTAETECRECDEWIVTTPAGECPICGSEPQ